MIQAGDIRLPVLAVKWLHLDALGLGTQAAIVDAHATGIRARRIKWLHTTGLAKGMLRNPRVESVGGDVPLPRQ